MRITRHGLCAMLATSVLAACGGGSTAPIGSSVGYTPSPSASVSPASVAFSIFIPAPSPALKRQRHVYDISSGTQSVSVLLAAVNGQSISGQRAAVIDVSASAPNCTAQSGGRTCTGTVNGARGNDAFTVSLYAGTNGSGALLDAGTVLTQVGTSGNIQLNDPLTVTLNPIIASLRVDATPDAFDTGTSSTSSVVVTPLDASGATILGAAAGKADVRISGGGNGAVVFSNGTSSEVTPFNTIVTVTYNGSSNIGAAVTLTATIDGSSSGVQASKAIALNAPPTPTPSPLPSGLVPQLYVLNQGHSFGRGATVTVYSLDAAGNAAPVRTIALKTSLAAQSIAVDKGGTLYVGYVQGEIDTYAFDANGNATPVTTLMGAGSSGTSISPIAITIDQSGDIVTIGKTNVGGLGGAAGVLEFQPGSHGRATPFNAWNFGSPAISLSGLTGGYVSGLALDGSGNFYVDGALAASSLSSVPGIFVAAPSASGNAEHATRTIAGTSTTTLPAATTDGTIAGLAIDGAGNIYESQYANAQTSAPAQINVFSAGASGGTTDVAPRNTITGTALNIVIGQGAPALSIAALNGSVYAANGSTNTVLVYDASAGTNATPQRTIAGSNTQLSNPVAIAAGVGGP